MAKSKEATFLSRYSKYRTTLQGKGKPGETVVFDNGIFTTDDPGIIKALRESREFGVTFFEDVTPSQAE